MSERRQRKADRWQNQEITTTQRKITTSAAVPVVVPITSDSEDDRDEGDEQGDRPSKQKRNVYEWHLVLNHASPKKPTQIAKSSHTTEREIENLRPDRAMTCEPCLRTKTKRAPHKRKQHHYQPGEAFCSDILGPIRTDNLNTDITGPERKQQEMYFITFTDVATRYVYVTPLRTRDKTAQLIDRFLTNFKQKWGRAPTWLITDNSWEYTSHIVMEILAEMNIEHEHRTCTDDCT